MATRLAILCGFASLALVGAGGSAAAALAADDVLWRADMETGNLAQWSAGGAGGVFNTGTGSVQVRRAMAHTGRYALRLNVRDADGTRGVQAARIFRWRTENGQPLPDAAYYSAWYLFPRQVAPIEWWIVFQWKTRIADGQSDPTFVLDVGTRGSTGRMYLYLYDHVADVNRGSAGIDLPVGKWVHIEAFYQWSTSQDGDITVYQNGHPIIAARDVQTEYVSPDPSPRLWSINSYTSGLVPSATTIFVDDAFISRRRAGPAAAARAAAGSWPRS
jgi:hypothetical protein